jgi:hypothetical protein
LGITVNLFSFEPLVLKNSCLFHPLFNYLGGVSLPFGTEIVKAYRRNLNMDIDAIEERTRYFGSVSLDLRKTAGALMPGI